MARFARMAATLIAAPLAMCAPPAYAQDAELQYLQLMNRQGFVITDAALMIAAGYRACEVLSVSSPEETVFWMAANHVNMTLDEALVLTATAKQVLCPEVMA